MNEPEDLVVALGPVARSLHDLGVPHYVGGSVASSFHGAARSTMDVDLIADMEDCHVSSFLNPITDDYYFHEPTVRKAVANKGCFNLVHLSTSFKVDIFVSKARPFDRAALVRATMGKLGEGDGIVVPVATSEDIILAKLLWYREGGEASERQWNDMTRLAKIKKDSLDASYLKQHASNFGLLSLLRRLYEEAGIESQ